MDLDFLLDFSKVTNFGIKLDFEIIGVLKVHKLLYRVAIVAIIAKFTIILMAFKNFH